MKLRAIILMFFVVGACRDHPKASTHDPMSGNEVVLGAEKGGVPPARIPLPDPPQPPPAPDGGSLLPLSRPAIARELAPGASCALDDTARGPLLATTKGDAIVNDNGRIVHLEPDAKDLSELLRGGRFIGNKLVIEIDRENQLGRIDEVTAWGASLRINRGKHGFASFHHRWTCSE